MLANYQLNYVESIPHIFDMDHLAWKCIDTLIGIFITT